MASGPIQVVLNAANFHVDREKTTGGGPGADFFAENDQAFIQHRVGPGRSQKHQTVNSMKVKRLKRIRAIVRAYWSGETDELSY